MCVRVSICTVGVCMCNYLKRSEMMMGEKSFWKVCPSECGPVYDVDLNMVSRASECACTLCAPELIRNDDGKAICKLVQVNVDLRMSLSNVCVCM